MVKKLSPRYRVILVIMLLAVALVATLVLLQNYNDSKEREMFMSLRDDMTALSAEFNRIDEGWGYSDSCRGKGEVYNLNEPSSCAVSINNNLAIENQQGIQSKLAAYRKVIENNTMFEVQNITTRQADNVIVFDIKELASGYCTLEGVMSSERNGMYTISYVCRHPANEFYFPRNDL